MRSYLFRLLLLAALQTYSLISYGQAPAPSVSPAPKNPEPIFLLNSTIIVNGALGQINPTDIDKVMIYKSSDTAPEPLHNLDSTGIVAITLKKSSKTIRSTSFRQVARQQKVQGKFQVMLNGQLLNPAQAATLRIVPEAIGQMQVLPATAKTPVAVLAIQLSASKPGSLNNPPGTIFIRGASTATN